ncbi:hypothetical protein P154DRAFT_531917 [Amniculicola lignicola CBS 123094]|uniref:Uncharacterized protein n=1 Tax=Amniculicola lignicola CBS 123094 TaxID=1392246 RepID=A0A6A5WSC7_9PLEO|nr:hypothetical protein P154DRAFT_531917 [Amniculicola lignicola CBS 123094]
MPLKAKPSSARSAKLQGKQPLVDPVALRFTEVDEDDKDEERLQQEISHKDTGGDPMVFRRGDAAGPEDDDQDFLSEEDEVSAPNQGGSGSHTLGSSNRLAPGSPRKDDATPSDSDGAGVGYPPTNPREGVPSRPRRVGTPLGGRPLSTLSPTLAMGSPVADPTLMGILSQRMQKLFDAQDAGEPQPVIDRLQAQVDMTQRMCQSPPWGLRRSLPTRPMWNSGVATSSPASRWFKS